MWIRRQIYAQGNALRCKFYMCRIDVKLKLFKSYCAPMYNAHLWWNYKRALIRSLYIAYHNIFKLQLGFAKYESTSLLCTVFDIQCCSAVIRNLVYRFMCRLDVSPNVFIRSIMSSSSLFTSRIRRHWLSLLYF